jgi:uncharacterized protein
MAASREAPVLTGPAGDIEAVLEWQAEAPSFVAVVCHPHPLFGGTMDNKVVTSLCRTVRDAGGVALRFNFRGVGRSQGAHGAGFTETEDLLAVVSWLRQRWPGLPLWLAGFSFGSWVALRGASALASDGAAPAHLLLVAPPVHNNDFDSVEHCGCPLTVVVGEDDEVVPVDEMLAWAGATPMDAALVRFPATGHFFHGRLPDLAEVARQTFP